MSKNMICRTSSLFLVSNTWRQYSCSPLVLPITRLIKKEYFIYLEQFKLMTDLRNFSKETVKHHTHTTHAYVQLSFNIVLLLFAAAKLGQIANMSKTYLKADQHHTKTLIFEVV